MYHNCINNLSFSENTCAFVYFKYLFVVLFSFFFVIFWYFVSDNQEDFNFFFLFFFVVVVFFLHKNYTSQMAPV